jgi:hypothetical protein
VAADILLATFDFDAFKITWRRNVTKSCDLIARIAIVID